MKDDLRDVRRRKTLLKQQWLERAVGGDLDALTHYLANGGDIDAKDEDGLALIHHAACQGDVSLIRKLREHGSDMNLLDDGSPAWKPTHYAIFHRKHEAEQVLRSLGAEVPLPILKKVAHEKPRVLLAKEDGVVFAGRV